MNELIRQLPERFFIDVAVGAAPMDEVCTLYNIALDDLEPHWDDPRFQFRLAQAKQAVEDDGSAFRARCRTVVHEAIPRIQRIIHDPDVPAQTQLTAFQTLVKYSGMEPTQQTKQAYTGPALSLTIIAPGGEAHTIEARVYDAEPVDDDEVATLASTEESALFALP